jgi:hypothetical protein
MSRDLLTAALRKLVVQAEAVVSQLKANADVTEALAGSSTPSEDLQELLGAAAAEARLAAVARSLAEMDVEAASEAADQLVAETNLWRIRLRQDLELVARADPRYEHDVAAIQPLLSPRLRRLAGTARWMANVAPSLAYRAQTFDACPSTVANDLRRAPALAEQLKAASALMNTTSMDRAREAARVQALRRILQQRLRLARQGWALAQVRNPGIPDLDLTILAGAVGRTNTTADAHQDASTDHQPPSTNHQPVSSCHQTVSTSHQTVSTSHQTVSTSHQTVSTNHQTVSTCSE